VVAWSISGVIIDHTIKFPMLRNISSVILLYQFLLKKTLKAEKLFFTKTNVTIIISQSTAPRWANALVTDIIVPGDYIYGYRWKKVLPKNRRRWPLKSLNFSVVYIDVLIYNCLHAKVNKAFFINKLSYSHPKMANCSNRK